MEYKIKKKKTCVYITCKKSPELLATPCRAYSRARVLRTEYTAVLPISLSLAANSFTTT